MYIIVVPILSDWNPPSMQAEECMCRSTILYSGAYWYWLGTLKYWYYFIRNKGTENALDVCFQNFFLKIFGGHCFGLHVCPGFQSQGGSLACFLACVILKFTSGVTAADCIGASMAAKPF